MLKNRLKAIKNLFNNNSTKDDNPITNVGRQALNIDLQSFTDSLSSNFSKIIDLFYAGTIGGYSLIKPLTLIGEIGLAIEGIFSTCQIISRIGVSLFNAQLLKSTDLMNLTIGGINLFQSFTEIGAVCFRLLNFFSTPLKIGAPIALNLGTAGSGLACVGNIMYMFTSTLTLGQGIKNYYKLRDILNHPHKSLTPKEQQKLRQAKSDMLHGTVNLAIGAILTASAVSALVSVFSANPAAFGVSISLAALGTVSYLIYRGVNYYYQHKNKPKTEQKNQDDSQLNTYSEYQPDNNQTFSTQTNAQNDSQVTTDNHDQNNFKPVTKRNKSENTHYSTNNFPLSQSNYALANSPPTHSQQYSGQKQFNFTD